LQVGSVIAALLTAVLLVPCLGSEAPDPKRVDEAVADLERAFEEGGAPERVAAMQRQAGVADARVVAWIGRGLRDREVEVRRGAIEALRFTAHPDALAALEELYRKDRGLRKDAETLTALLRAVGQHRSPSSIALLSEDVWGVEDHGVVQAHLFGLGHIRDPRSVEALMGAMKSAGRTEIQPFMEDFRLALMVLTGVDQGPSQDLWIRWWNDNKRDLVVAEEEPALPKMLAQRWAYYWGRGRLDERPRKRGDRGNDG
jgi:HEAT repeats